MSNELANKEAPGVLASVSDDMLDFLRAPALTRNFLVLGQGSSKEVGSTGISAGQLYIKDPDPLKSVPVGSFERIGAKLSCQLDSVYGHWRPKAVLLIDNSPVAESFDPSSETFRKIIHTTEVKAGAGPKQITPLFGIETLHYIPPHMFDFDAVKSDKKRALNPADVDTIARKFKRGCLATFFWAKNNKENTCGGGPERGGVEYNTPIRIRTEEKQGSKFNWWVIPHREIIPINDSNREWIEYGISLMTPELLAAFHNPAPQGGETIENNKTEGSASAPAGMAR